ncbi:hypothetical protein Tco_0681459 [Tanacetum coccineum]|uniref:Integrase, catalytic region, zinc finger, CCHC-type, peptidase aspartic, catalytic n=1 Tax=Tanacetum coccineum TaxID=301880 RepID=A0ABQ4XQ30_9ASTR
MANLSEDIQCVSSDTRPPMLDRTDFASWQQRIRLYYQGKENGVNILKSIDKGPFQMGRFWETLAEGNEGALHLGPERSQVYSDLSPEDKERYNADIQATNILLQGLPKDIYSLINHYINVKDIWDNVKMLLEGSELTKEDRESQLYDDFEHFCQHKGETIHDYYVRFAKLINDMRNIKMTMSKMQLNSKFVNNMLPEWGRFVTTVKLNRGLRDSNYDQLYAYLKQHEAHANEKKMRLERFTVDPLALMSNVSHQQYNSQSSTNPSSIYGNNARGAGAAGYEGAQNRVGNANPCQVKQIKCYNCNADDCDAFDYDVDEAPTAQTMFISNLSSADPVYDEVVHEMHDDVQPNYIVDSHTDYTSDSNMIPYDQYVKENAVPVVQSNVSSVPNDAYMMILNDIYESSAQLVEEVTSLKKDFKQKENKYLEEFLDMKALKEKNKVAIGYKNPLCLTRAKQVQPALYNGYEIIKTNHVSAIVYNSEDTLEIAEITRNKINDNMKDPECVKKKVKIAPHDYSKENYLATSSPPETIDAPCRILVQLLIQDKDESSQRATHSFTNQSKR